MLLGAFGEPRSPTLDRGPQVEPRKFHLTGKTYEVTILNLRGPANAQAPALIPIVLPLGETDGPGSKKPAT